MPNSDNPTSESSALDTNQAAAAFASLLDPKEPEAAESPEAAAERIAAEEASAEVPEPVAQDPQEGTQKIPVTVDGKIVELTPEEIADHYKNGLRQQDYTRKTMEAAEARKAAEAEANTARAERQHYANQLQNITQQLQGALQEQSQIDWQQLLEQNPTEYLKQKHLFEQRQAAYQQAQQEQGKLYQQQQAEQANYLQNYLSQQQQELLAKLPDWKDEGKAKAEKAAIAEYLTKNGFQPDEVGKIADHRLVVMAREAMKYRELMTKAQAATKKVAPLPAKVERPGNGDVAKPDGRTAAMQRLNKSGRVEDAAAVFAQLL